jgi:hypothetical protein
LVTAQWREGASIFGCDDWEVLSNGDGGDMRIGSYLTPRIPAPQVNMGSLDSGATTTSWLNTMIFMQAWQLVGKDNRFRYHDWTVKVDPDAVFFPDRLLKVVRPLSHKVREEELSPKLYLANCNLYVDKGWSTFFGSLEVFSREAIESYLYGWTLCKRKLPWHGWGEDLFISECMETLGVKKVDEFGMLADQRCFPAPCADTSKVVYHDFKNINDYFSCWRESAAAEQLPAARRAEIAADGLRDMPSWKRKMVEKAKKTTTTSTREPAVPVVGDRQMRYA